MGSGRTRSAIKNGRNHQFYERSASVSGKEKKRGKGRTSMDATQVRELTTSDSIVRSSKLMTEMTVFGTERTLAITVEKPSRFMEICEREEGQEGLVQVGGSALPGSTL